MQGHLGCVVDFERKEKVTVELRVIPNGPETDASEQQRWRLRGFGTGSSQVVFSILMPFNQMTFIMKRKSLISHDSHQQFQLVI